MKWIKDALIDIVVTVIVILATFGGMEWAWWAVAVYSPFMLLLKLAAFSGRHKPSKIKPVDAGVPTIVFHVLYGANVLITAYYRWWWVAGCWAAIWILSAISGKGKPKK